MAAGARLLPDISLITVTIANRQRKLPVDRRRMRRTVEQIVRDAEITAAQISLAIVDDPTIAKLHQQFLGDPEPTDVLSFLLERRRKCSKAKWSSARIRPGAAHRATAARPPRSCCVRHPRYAAPGRLRRHDGAKASRDAKTGE